MALYERVTGDPCTLSPHLFMAVFREWARGALTNPQVIAALNADAGDQTELIAIKATYDVLGTDAEKQSFMTLVHDVMLLAQMGKYDKTTCKARLGF